MLVKCDHDLPVTGCIKARGGVYEVLWYAECIAIRSGLLRPGDSYSVLAGPEARAILSQHTVAVGSTGNLGFSVGMMARALGLNAEVHMSSDAKEWKKERLRRINANVIEHPADYSIAVAEARRASAGQSRCHFIDDEDSVHLFLGYAAAARDLRRQLDGIGVAVSEGRPLVVYLPCGVGGAPGGIAFGLKIEYGDAVSCVFVEPVQAPCMLVQLAMGLDKSVSVYNAGLTNRTEADGLAVPSASLFVARSVCELVDAIVTVTDEGLFKWARKLWIDEGLKLEPSAAAGFAAVEPFVRALHNSISSTPAETTHVVWTTGGAFLPPDIFAHILERGSAADGT